MNQKHLFLAVAAVGALTGFYLANSPSGTGIYKTPLGSLAANVYMAGNKLAGNKAPATSTPAAT